VEMAWMIFFQIRETNDGGFILGGYSGSGISGDKTESCAGVVDYWVVKTDEFGNIIWQNTIGGNAGDYLNSIFITEDNGYLLGGYSSSVISGVIKRRQIWVVMIIGLLN
jgi:hypothetical protein